MAILNNVNIFTKKKLSFSDILWVLEALEGETGFVAYFNQD